MKNESDIKATRTAAIATLWMLNIIGLVALDTPPEAFLPIQYYILFYAIPVGVYLLAGKGYYIVTPTMKKGDE